ncbi:cryptochrome/photolyase family protein [Ensifer soli]|uniref:cryptochrome/photolyase family protein n=1 Tax=Ciceribacter sp. sgz301302 TaxID=3342379 RepID=UPI0035B8B8CC
MTRCRHLIFLLGDQLSPAMSSLREADPARDVVLICEVAEEATYVAHHAQKLVFFFSAMRHFADELTAAGFRVRYVRLDDPENTGALTGELRRAAAALNPERIVITEPGEWRVEQALSAVDLGDATVEMREDDRFLCSRADFARFADGRRSLVMEFFYREMRRRTGLLMQGDRPAGGRWNFDSENRKPARPDLFRPPRRPFAPDAITRAVIALVEARFPGHMGDARGFGLAVTRAEAERAADDFIADFLPAFGDTQDAMLRDDPFLNHALLSPYLNVGLLDPLSLCRSAERAYEQGDAPLNAVEGFIRQIIGWREYMRGIYWRFMPAYAEGNHFGARRPLPDFFWTGRTRMACLATVIGATIRNAYAHHIQRLMITGNFALLAALDPKAVHVWYLEVYADAVEWVELPNVIGMSQFADGGLLGSKPYAAGGAYISRMSDYCEGCAYDVRRRTGEGACPFNALYWDFIGRNEALLSGNRRMAQTLSTWRRMTEADRTACRDSARDFLARLDAGENV